MNRLVSAETSVCMETLDTTKSVVPRNGRQLDSTEKKSLRLWLFMGLIVPLLGMSPLLVLQGRRLVEQQSLLYFPFPIALGIWLLVRTCDYRPASVPRARMAVFLVWCGIGFSVLGTYLYSPWIVQFAAVVVASAWSLAAFGGAKWTRIVAICSLFAIAVPLPSGQDMQLNFRLQAISISACSGFLDAIGVPHIVEGNVLQIADTKVLGSEVCGGADSIYAFTAIGLGFLVLRRCSLLAGLMTLVSIPVFFVFGNFVRLLVIAIGIEKLDSNFMTGLGFVAVAITASALSILALLLWYVSINAILEPISEGRVQNKLTMFYQWLTAWPQTNKDTLPSEHTEAPSTAPWKKATTWRPSFVTMLIPSLLCLMVGMISAYAVFFTANDIVFTGISDEKAAGFPSQDAFPDQFGSLRKISFTPTTQKSTDPRGRYSHAWKFDDRGNQVFAALVFPFARWNPLWTGYQAAGWKIIEIKPVTIPSATKKWTLEEFKMQNQYGLFGYVWYAFFDENGVPVERPIEVNTSTRINIFARIQNKRPVELPRSCCVQVLFESGRELTDSEIERNRTLFIEIFESIRQQSESALKKAK